jgi:hypothetical protein
LKLRIAFEFPLVVARTSPKRYIDFVFPKPKDVSEEVFEEILSKDIAVEVSRVFSERRWRSIIEKRESMVVVHSKSPVNCGFQVE